MPTSAWTPGMPRRILLATDLSSRCDRALDRAMFLARAWNATLVVLTVVESATSRRTDASPADRHVSAYNQLRRDIASSDADVPVEVVVREGDASEQISAVAAGTGCRLIITGTARNELFGRTILGSNVERVARTSQLPLLTVHSRLHGPYTRIAVASDFSASSRHALDTILGLIPDAQPALFHAFDVPLLGLMDTQRDEAIDAGRSDALLAAEAFLRNAGHPDVPVIVAHGAPAERLREHAGTHDIDLIVIAGHRRSAIYKVLIGSVAQRILETAPCDTLLVPEPQARGRR